MAKKTVILTENQVAECMAQISEMTISGDEALNNNNGDMKSATKEVMNSARKSGTNVNNGGVSVSYSADALDKYVTESYTKKEIKEHIQSERLKKLHENCTRFTKEGLRKAMLDDKL